MKRVDKIRLLKDVLNGKKSIEKLTTQQGDSVYRHLSGLTYQDIKTGKKRSFSESDVIRPDGSPFEFFYVIPFGSGNKATELKVGVRNWETVENITKLCRD